MAVNCFDRDLHSHRTCERDHVWSPPSTHVTFLFRPEFKRIAAFQGDFTFTGARRFFLEHASRTQPAWSWRMYIRLNASCPTALTTNGAVNKRGKSTPYIGASHTSHDSPVISPYGSQHPFRSRPTLLSSMGSQGWASRFLLWSIHVETNLDLILPVNFINNLDPNDCTC
jgi:hypothetical protein